MIVAVFPRFLVHFSPFFPLITGVVNDFLSHPTWQPLSRLTYSIYLVALPIQLLATFNLKDLVYFSHIDKVCRSIYNFVYSLKVEGGVSKILGSVKNINGVYAVYTWVSIFKYLFV